MVLNIVFNAVGQINMSLHVHIDYSRPDSLFLALGIFLYTNTSVQFILTLIVYTSAKRYTKTMDLKT